MDFKKKPELPWVFLAMIGYALVAAVCGFMLTILNDIAAGNLPGETMRDNFERCLIWFGSLAFGAAVGVLLAEYHNRKNDERRKKVWKAR